MELLSKPLTWIIIGTVVMFFGSIVLGWGLIVRMPCDYLATDQIGEQGFRKRHPMVAMIMFIVTNLLGAALLFAGLIMLLTPGQGLLFIFLGVAVMDFPGKKNLIRRLVGNPNVLNMINKIRARASKPPLEIPYKQEPM